MKYESADEAAWRLTDTIVTYNGIPYYVLGCFYKRDGEQYAYLCESDSSYRTNYCETITDYFDGGGSRAIRYLESFEGDSNILSVPLDSWGFNNFHPFSMGMVNSREGLLFFSSRMPIRAKEQGLIPSMVKMECITQDPLTRVPSIYSTEFRLCVEGVYPDQQTSFESVRAGRIGTAFDRQFGYCRLYNGIIGLAYETDIVGICPCPKSLMLEEKFSYLQEEIEESDFFNQISMDPLEKILNKTIMENING